MPRHIKVDGAFVDLGGNATVPEDAPIQPSQVFVESIGKISQHPEVFGGLDLTGLGITYLAGTLVANYAAMGAVLGQPVAINCSNNAISNTNEILSALAALIVPGFSPPDSELDLSGGTTIAPTGQGIIDAAALVTGGWTVTTN